MESMKGDGSTEGQCKSINRKLMFFVSKMIIGEDGTCGGVTQ